MLVLLWLVLTAQGDKKTEALCWKMIISVDKRRSRREEKDLMDNNFEISDQAKQVLYRTNLVVQMMRCM